VLPFLPYADNSLVGAICHGLQPVRITGLPSEVLLEGATDQWFRRASWFSFIQWPERGQLRLSCPPGDGGRARRRGAHGLYGPTALVPGLVAWAIYVITAISLVLSIAWFYSYMERREKERLERLVAERTAELGQQVKETLEKSAALAASEERYRQLNTELEARVVDRTAQLSKTNVDLKREIAERQRAEQEVGPRTQATPHRFARSRHGGSGDWRPPQRRQRPQ